MNEGSPIIIVGHSHLVSFSDRRFVLSNDSQSELAPAVSDGFEILFGAWPRGHAYWEQLYALAPFRRIGLCWLGQEYLSAFLFEQDNGFDFLLPGSDSDLEEGRQIAPYRLVREVFMPGLSHLDNMISKLKASEGCKPFLMASPPPRGDYENFSARTAGANSWLNSVAANLNEHFKRCGKAPPFTDLTKLKLSSLRLLHKTWLVSQILRQELATKHDIPFIWPPTTALDADGRLDPELASDWVHANQTYGRMMLEHTLRSLGG